MDVPTCCSLICPLVPISSLVSFHPCPFLASLPPSLSAVYKADTSFLSVPFSGRVLSSPAFSRLPPFCWPSPYNLLLIASFPFFSMLKLIQLREFLYCQFNGVLEGLRDKLVFWSSIFKPEGLWCNLTASEDTMLRLYLLWTRPCILHIYILPLYHLPIKNGTQASL